MKAFFDFFQKQQWRPFPFQEEIWSAYLQGKSGLLQAPTGTGKTYAVLGGPILEALREKEKNPTLRTEGLKVLWITPLRALAADTAKGIARMVQGAGLGWNIETRTGDSPSSLRARQKLRFPSVLLTTPESLSLLLSYPETRGKLESLRCVIVDEWHELMGSKRGVQTELCLARLRRFCPSLKIWGLSATLGNLEEARDTLLGSLPREQTCLVRGEIPKTIAIKTLLPPNIQRFPWAGHLGLNLLPQVVSLLDDARSTLIFTNTRSQTELWYQALVEAKPEWEKEISIHHGSIDRVLREAAERGLAEGSLRAVVCTSSLDLGVDFTPVEQVLQIGSPRGMARLLQRAGRSGHQPQAVSRIIGVPTNALELIEFSAARTALAQGRIESRPPLQKPLDLLAQHLVTLILGGDFHENKVFEEIKTTHAFRDLNPLEWRWTLDFIERGGKTLSAYPQFSKVKKEGETYLIQSKALAHLHRMGIGTITSDQAMNVKFLNESYLGQVEESFVAKLQKGESFVFAGRCLELVRTRDMTAYVRLSPSKKSVIPRWLGGRLSLSSELADEILKRLDQAREGVYVDAQMRAVRPILEIQNTWSHLPSSRELLTEQIAIKGAHHVFLYPFAGKLAHEGLSALLAYRLTQLGPRSLTFGTTDYGLVLVSHHPFPQGEEHWRKLFSRENLLEDILACMNTLELARRQFREIARIAGLIIQRFPGKSKTARQLQTSSGLLFDVFSKHDSENLLLHQAKREVLEQQLEFSRLKQLLERIETLRFDFQSPRKITPFGFSLWAQSFQSQATSESWKERVERMALVLEKAAEGI